MAGEVIDKEAQAMQRALPYEDRQHAFREE